jgi:hypothetical protein
LSQRIGQADEQAVEVVEAFADGAVVGGAHGRASLVIASGQADSRCNCAQVQRVGD